jgi:glucokinase
MTQTAHWLGVDLGGTKMLAALYDGAFTLVAERKEKTKGQAGPQAVLDRLQQLISDTLKDAGVSLKNLDGLGLGVPGPVNIETGAVLSAPNLGWRNLSLQGLLERACHCPVRVYNDVDAGTYGEYRFGAGRQKRCVIGLFPGTGIGGGCIYEGKIFSGTQHSCFEVGHLRVVPEGRLCGCGRRGCLEAHASRLAIAADVAAAAYRGQAPALLKLAGTELRDIKSRTLAKAIAAGDQAVEEIVRRAARQLGLTAAGLVNLLAPDVIILGGGLVEALGELYLEEVRSAVERRAMPLLGDTVKIRVAQLGDHATALGAAALVAAACARH